MATSPAHPATPALPMPGTGDPGDGPAARLADRIRALALGAGVLQLGAHPDDEEGGTLALLARGHGLRVVYWSATRGEGGQNKRGPERGDALGVLRTWETLDARRIDGAEALFGPFIDFGFAKTGEAALSRWGHDAVLREVVRAIRLVQPMVVLARWRGTPADGHGHHQAIGSVTDAAIAAAADPTAFPELELPAWQVVRVFRSLAGDWQPGEAGEFGVIVPEHEAAGHLRVDTGVADPGTGLSYQELAALAINRHRSQGIGVVPEPGAYHLYYEGPSGGLLGDLDPTLVGLATHLGVPSDPLARIVAHVEAALDAFRPREPARAAPHLLAAVGALRDAEARAGHEALAYALARRRAEAEAVAAVALGLRLDATVDRARIVPGRTMRVRAEVLGDAAVRDLRLEVPDGWTVENGAQGRWTVAVPPDAPPTTPYWVREPHGPDAYVWPEDAPCGQALDEPLVIASAVVETEDQILELRAAVTERGGFPGGARALPVTVLPRLALTPRQDKFMVATGSHGRKLTIDVAIEQLELGAQGRLVVRAPAGWVVEPAEVALPTATGAVSIDVVVPDGAVPGQHELRLTLEGEGCAGGVELGPVRLGAPGAPGVVDEHSAVVEAHLVRPAGVEVDVVEVEFVRTLRYGYVRGMDEDVPEVLAALGLELDELTDDDLRHGDLDHWDAIVVGPRAYELRAEVRRQAARLLAYVGDGGTLVVQFQGYGYGAAGLAPHPIAFSQPHDRVTDPRAPVTVIDDTHPVLRTPNVLTPADFDGWVHDRGMYFAGTWDRRCFPMLAMADPGEVPREGALLTAAYGRGTWVYAALSFFRQLPAGVPGAIRLFANVLGLADARVRERAEHLRGVELLQFLDDDERYEAARIVSERWYDAGTIIANAGEPGRELFVLISGEVEVFKHDRVLHRARPGETLGELSLLASIPRTASMRAVTDVIVLVLREETLAEWLIEHPELARKMLGLLAHKVVARDPV